ncbi:hypothetical protein ACILDT_04495 [Capnocytophaga canis]|uniref:hypothetical protein n=2 Tax=Capnocytophaga TaxID=1016 RepID=UPI0015628195|nr:hypothetical protein [Capnocytophaga canis]
MKIDSRTVRLFPYTAKSVKRKNTICLGLQQDNSFEKLGGQGQYAYYKNTLKRIVYMSNSENSNSESAGDDDKWRRCLSDVLEADGMSASVGFIISAGVAVGSGGTLAIPALIGVAIESGAASAWAYYRSSNC